MPESQKKELFSAGITYMVSGEYAFAFSCFTQAGKSDLPTLYNMESKTVIWTAASSGNANTKTR